MLLEGARFKIYVGRTGSIRRRVIDYAIGFQLHSPNDFKVALLRGSRARSLGVHDLTRPGDNSGVHARCRESRRTGEVDALRAVFTTTGRPASASKSSHKGRIVLEERMEAHVHRDASVTAATGPAYVAWFKEKCFGEPCEVEGTAIVGARDTKAVVSWKPLLGPGFEIFVTKHRRSDRLRSTPAGARGRVFPPATSLRTWWSLVNRSAAG